MAKKKVLYISGSGGLGHVTRDLAIAEALHRQNPEVELSWMAAEPASLLIKEAGEKLLPEADLWANETLVMEDIARENVSKGKIYQLNVVKFVFNSKAAWAHNVEIFGQVMSKEHFDLVVGDEAYETAIALREKHIQIEPTFVMMYDFIGVDSMTKKPLEKLGTYLVNRRWARGYKNVPDTLITLLFVGEEEDVPDKKFGFLLPNRRDHVKGRYNFVGYIAPFNPAEYVDKVKIRAELGYGEESLVVCSIGGTAIGKPLFELCGQAYPIIKEKIPDIRMVLVCGPRLSPESLEVPEGVEVKGYVPALYEHFAASDLAIVQGGGTTTLELTALRRPFLYFPIEEHCEQQLHVARRLARHQAGIKMQYSQTIPETLAEMVISNIGKEATWAPIPTDGAQRAAQLIGQLL